MASARTFGFRSRLPAAKQRLGVTVPAKYLARDFSPALFVPLPAPLERPLPPAHTFSFSGSEASISLQLNASSAKLHRYKGEYGPLESSLSIHSGAEDHKRTGWINENGVREKVHGSQSWPRGLYVWEKMLIQLRRNCDIGKWGKYEDMEPQGISVTYTYVICSYAHQSAPDVDTDEVISGIRSWFMAAIWIENICG
ncbi:hypothetical protein Nepgr_005991 [Nepenthes gracilis]|uniref:Uncharacterized protein n=1 Tax=Nepenthes gracilis TaxID=150966 RepID=A0AAD3XGY8_NEPGR|nr:hypothetical protein Nepgr_005991 [Nepenthes gracilis]